MPADEDVHELESNEDDAVDKDEDYKDEESAEESDAESDEDYTPAPKRRRAEGGARASSSSAPAKSSSTKQRPKATRAPRAPKFTFNRLELQLQALTKGQLVEMVTNFAKDHAVIREHFENLGAAPAADVEGMRKELEDLYCKMKKAFPQARYGSNRDNFAYKRVKPSLVIIKEYILKHGQEIVKGQNWPSVVSFLRMAWAFACRLPVFEGGIDGVRPMIQTRIVGMYKKVVKAHKKLDAAGLQQLRDGLKEAGADADVAPLLAQLP
eukprot:tig00020537_g10244.t1